MGIQHRAGSSRGRAVYHNASLSWPLLFSPLHYEQDREEGFEIRV